MEGYLGVMAIKKHVTLIQRKTGRVSGALRSKLKRDCRKFRAGLLKESPSGLQSMLVRKKATETDGNYAGLRDYLSQNMATLEKFCQKTWAVSVDRHSYPAKKP